MTGNLFDLERFVAAQEHSYATALAELRAGRKRSHWIWYIFPQLKGLGFSAMSQRYAIDSLAEAKAYLEHPLLGARLRTCVATMDALPPQPAEHVLGAVDAAKFRSCLTLFIAAGADFQPSLERWYGGAPDSRTLELLRD